MAKTNEELKQIATQVRRDILRMVCMAKSGHPGGSMGSTDILTTLYFNQMNQNPATWTRDGKGQDMFILSAGHMTPGPGPERRLRPGTGQKAGQGQ